MLLLSKVVIIVSEIKGIQQIMSTNLTRKIDNMTTVTTSNTTQQDLTVMQELRLKIKGLVTAQKEAKAAKQTATTVPDMAKLQSTIAIQRREIAIASKELQTVRERLSQIPYGQSTPACKMEHVSNQLNIVKEEYQATTKKQYELKKAIQSSQFGGESLSEAQKEKHRNKKTIQALVAKRSMLKVKHKAFSDIIFEESKVQVAA